PCQNHGLCFHKGMNDSYCVCPKQFTGDRCERGKPIFVSFSPL
ncbi:MAG: hypothetical protein AB2693_30570, partial [Candidatus Thiodiazotropha sp.]